MTSIAPANDRDQFQIRRFSRRDFVRIASISGLAIAAPAVLLPRAADASITWCRSDPLVKLAGVPVKIDIAVLEDDLHLVNGPTGVHITVPRTVTREFIWADEGLNGLGYKVSFNQGMREGTPPEVFTATIKVHVKTKDKVRIPVAVYCTPADGEPSEYIFEDPQRPRVTVKFKVHSHMANSEGVDYSAG